MAKFAINENMVKGIGSVADKSTKIDSAKE